MASKTVALGLGVVLGVAMAGAASAADLYTPPPATSPVMTEPTPAFSWAGHFFGIQAGGYFGDESGAIGGIYGGANWQHDWLVYGLDLNANYAFGDNDGFRGNIRGRAGVAHDRLLLYGTAGVAGMDVGDFETGYTLGGGAEYAHTDDTSIRLDYSYTDVGSGVDDHTVMLGVAFRGWPSAGW